jgi:hypothetical protein
VLLFRRGLVAAPPTLEAATSQTTDEEGEALECMAIIEELTEMTIVLSR